MKMKTMIIVALRLSVRRKRGGAVPKKMMQCLMRKKRMALAR
jgi:hypothetical protein